MTDDYCFRNVEVGDASSNKALRAMVCLNGQDVVLLWIDHSDASAKHHWYSKDRRLLTTMLTALADEDVSLDDFVRRLLEKWRANPPRYRCTFCGGDCWEETCPRCGHSDAVFDKRAPHRCEWSRKTINTVECKICDRTLSMAVYLQHGGAPPDDGERRLQ